MFGGVQDIYCAVLRSARFGVINIVVLYYSKGRRTGFWVCIIADRWNTIIVKMWKTLISCD
jgi:S-ribosylhomocysteine lyase LuxS involved in autoinducer biosynthesis